MKFHVADRIKQKKDFGMNFINRLNNFNDIYNNNILKKIYVFYFFIKYNSIK